VTRTESDPASDACGAALSRRGFLAVTASLLSAPAARRNVERFTQQRRPLPSAAQLEWQHDELALFLHFGINTFTDREWGDGRENPRLFAPTRPDTRQWARVARECGFRALILTAKHHDGFCLWPTRTTDHSVARSPWRDGGGDLVREFVTACREEQLKAGFYLSPWDRHEPSYGDSPRYNDFYAAQLTELLTQDGPVHEVWFDGANGEGPNGKRQEYDWPRTWNLVRRLQPNAVIFSDAGPDVRWIGNEQGLAGDPNWSTVDPAVLPVPGVSGAAVMQMLQHGDPRGSVWRPGETDVSIRPGWFHHPAEDARVRSADQLVDLYFTSVGRNSKLLLNVPPTREGLLPLLDVERLRGMRARLTAMFGQDLAAGRLPTWRRTGARTAELELDLGRTVTVSIADLRENITRGQVVAGYTLEGWAGGGWQRLSRGSTIGYRKLDRFPPMRVRALRLYIEDALDAPHPVALTLYGDA
jgi:alpha-L-fucosidase